MKLTASMIQGIQAPFSKPERNKVSSPCYCFHQIVLVYILIANLHSSRSQFQEYCPDRPPTIVQMSCGPPYQTQCIMSDWVCDSRPDCPNGADESNATCNAVRGLPSVSACDIQPCNNGATCSHFSRQDTVVVAYYRCTCAPGFTGDNCEFGSPGTTQSSNVPTTATLTTTIIRSQETTTLRMTTISMKSAAIKAETTTEPSPTTAGDVSNQKTTFTTSDPLTPSETTQLSTFDATSQSHGTTTSPKSTTLPATTSSSSIPMTTTQAITNQLVSVAVTTSSLPSVDGSVCEPSPCVNGVCTPLRNGYHCSCFTGYSGSTCLRMTNPCASQPCQNSISCYILNGEFSCVCRTGFTGRQCDVKMFDCKSFPCKNGGSCIEGSSRFHCECMKGFEGTYCEENINDCASAPCQHGGTCRDGIGFYTCRCSKDRAGENCQRPQNCLDGDPCLNHGVCHHTSSLSPLKRCYCLPGFTGTLCEENVNECLSSPCGQNGKCMDGINSYTCDCHPGYTGEHCETNVDYCSPNPCQNGGQCCNRNGRCFYLTTDFECYCPRGFTGALCEVQASACYSNPCINGGVCKQNGNSYTCTCPLTFSGSQCQVNEPCASAPCIGDGTCQNNASGFICHCSQDFYGTYCEHPQPCYNKPCQNQGTCVDLENAYACQCGSNFTGIHCEFLQPCAPQPCQNGGQCENIDLVQYKCHCLEDYTGVNCENPLGCSSNPCMNNGDCSNRGLQDFTCACTYEYYGDRCQTFSPCSSLPCQNTGSCSDVSESNYSCACPQDFTGRNCESVIPCSLQPCQNNGVCTDIGVTGYTCLCQPDNTGANCESILPCSLAPCLNGASCTDVQDGGYECQCTSNYTGVNCSLYIPCSSSPCHNGATCANDRKGFKCVCPPYYTGVQCDVMFGCASNPCLQGTCVDIPGSYICNCPVTFTGQNCETFLQCSSSPCQNEATCTNNLIQNSYTCSCSQNFTGAKCETRIPCTLSPCLNNGVCVNEITGYRCNCTGTYEGKNCQTNLPCKSSPCINGGTCLNNGNTFICQNCDAPYRGLRCEILDPCGYHTPCNTGGSRLCNNVGSTFQCLCQPGYTGVRCETYLPCFTSPCLNGGTCTNLPKGYVCNCLSNFGGRNCETSNPCGSNPCQNNGVCFNNGLDYTCQCMQDFTGSRCESLLPCAKQPCVNGTCINQDLFVHKCSCSTGYTGQRCETAVLVCDNSTCVNGMCQTVQGKMTCICYSGFAGSQCDRVRSQCDLQPCQHSGICQNSGTSYMCTCTVAYTGQDCETRVRACDQQPCFNGATCNNLADSYNCTCTAEYTGPSCQSKILPCDSAPCQNNATCTDVDTGYSCHCTERYKGSQCEERISACESTPCQNNGYCLVTGDTYTCACQPPFSGQNCEIEIKTCVPNPCRQGGTCFVDPLGVYCFCHSGFDGILCEKDKGKCNPNPCLNNGVCFQVLGQAKCDCANGFSGDTCQTPVVGCSPDPCNGGGCVEDGHGRFQCKCSPGRFGAQCQLVDPCFVVPCKNRGECKRASDASYECTCTTGYSGATCETLLPACTRSPCQNGASCSDGGSLTSYTCVCATGFTGSDCSTNIDDCNRHACQNGAACVDRINSYSCDCSPGFSGQFCADRDSCSNGPCVRGNCRGVPNSQYGTQYTCDCPQNYYGANCQSYNFCYLVPCRNGAFCKNEAANYKCTCSAGYTGATCEQLIDNCVGVVCQNGGSCVNQLLGYSCQCEGSYFGRHCELSDACSGKPCGNNGVCTSLDNSTSNLRFQCNCINNYTGDLCQQVDYCNTAQCGPGSVCQLTTTGFICVCPAGLTGSNCEVDIDDCNPNPCHHSGTCTDQVNGYTCDCLAPYSGSQCTVTPCSASPCGTVPGTKCNIADFSYTCSCPIGWKGKTCSQSISIITPGFNSDGYLSYIKTYVNNQVSIRLTFSTNTTTGILAYAESGNFYHGIFIDSGRVFFRMQNGFSTDLILRSIASYNNGELYTVFVEQNSTHIRMNVALETIATTHMSPAAIGTWTVYLGGRPDVTSVSNLTGCIHELEISGQSVNLVSDAFQGYNVDSCYQPVCPGVSCSNRGTCEERDGNLYECVCQSGFSGHDCQFSDCDFNPCQRGSCHMEAAGRRCHCPLGYAGPDCSLVTRVNITAFRASSHIKYCNLAKSTQLRQSYMMLKFRTETDNGLLLYMSNGLVPSGDFFSLAIVNRRLQLKFNVGGGDGTLMSKPLPLDTWLTAIVERNGSQAQLTVEGYSTSNGAATGSLQDLNVDGCVYIGGTPDMIVVGPRTDSSQGLTGCLLNLQINDVEYSPAMAVSGADISQCNADLCNSTVNPCVYGSCISSPGAYTCNCDAQHHGLNCEFLKDGCHQNSQCLQGSTCIPTGTGFLCSCLLQFTGAFCNETQDLQKVVPFFRGLSYLEFSPPTGVASITNIQLTFRTGSSNGLLLYMSQGTKVGDFLSVGITSGSIEVHMNLGSGVLVLKGPPIQLHQWYTANMRRRGRTVSLVLGDQELTAVATGTSQGLSVSSNLLLGGAPDYNQLNADVGFLQGFIGCIQELKIGGATVTEITWNDAIGGRGISQCSHSPCTSVACSGRGRCQVISDASYTCLCAVGYSGQTCSLATVIDRPLFNRDGHLSLSRVLTNPRQTNISVELRPLSDSGSILYNTKDADFIALELDNGFVKFSYNLGTGTGLLVSRQPLVMDTWHTITASRSSRNGQLVVNNANVVQGSSPPGGVSMDYNDITYIGGLPTNIAPSNQDFLIAGFHGCIRKLVVESRVVDMTTPAGGYGISQCPIRYCESHQCTAGSTCLENDKSLSGYSCQCPPGVAGTYCNMTVCEVHPGNTMCQNGGSCYMDNGSAKCLCLLGFKDNTCSTVSTFNLAKFTSSRSFLAYNSSDIIRSRHSFAVEIIFKTSLSTGLLLWYGKPNDDYIAVGIEGGQIQCIIKLDSQPSTTFTLQPAVNRDEYFLLKIERLESSLSLTLQSMVGDKTQGSWSLQGQDTQLDTQDDKVYIGGVHGDVQSRTSGHFVSPFSGCIAQLKFGNLQNGQFSYNRVQLQQDAVDGEGIESCVT